MISPFQNWETLSLAKQVAQLIVVRASGHLFDSQIQYPDWEPPSARLCQWVQELGVGGVILLGGSAAEVALRTQQLQEWATVPLFIAADVEEGVGQRFAGATWFPPPLALNAIAQADLELAIAYAEQMGATTAQEALAIGINWVLAPIVDVNNNPDNPVINVRAWGETPAGVSHLTTAFLRGVQRYPALTTAKHFPGHGDTAVDSHLALPVISHSRSRLAAIEFPPFKAAIAQGVDAVMTAHLQVPALDDRHPATFSAAIVTELRQQMGFEGLIVTDALIMGAITNRYRANEAPVLAIEAGADVLMMPVDPVGAIAAICAAVETGRIAIEQIHASLARIWQAKGKLQAGQLTGDLPEDQPSIQLEQIAQPEAAETVAGILRHSMQVRPEPLRPEPSHSDTLPAPRNLILVDDVLNSPFLGRQVPAIALPTAQGYSLQVVDRHTPDLILGPENQPTLLQLFVRSTPFRGSAGLTPTAWNWLKFLLKANQLQALVVYGSPYAFNSLLPLLPAELPYVFTYGQMPAAQAIALSALFGEVQTNIQQGDRVFTD